MEKDEMLKQRREFEKETKALGKGIYTAYKKATGSKIELDEKTGEEKVGKMTTTGKVIADIGFGILALLGLGS